MKWEEVRRIYPNQFVKFEVKKSHIVDNKEYVDDVAVISAVIDGREALSELIKKTENQFVYSTKNEKVTSSHDLASEWLCNRFRKHKS